MASEDGLVVPNDNFRLFFPKEWNATVKDWYALEHSLRCGMYMFFLGTIKKSGLYAILKEKAGDRAACFLLDQAMYWNFPRAGEGSFESLMERELTFSTSPREKQLQNNLKVLTLRQQREIEEEILAYFAGTPASLLVCAEQGCLAAISRREGRPLFVLYYGKQGDLLEAVKEASRRLMSYRMPIRDVFCTKEEACSSCQELGASLFFPAKLDTLWSKIKKEASSLKEDYGKLLSSRGVFVTELAASRRKEEGFSLLFYEEPCYWKAARELYQRLSMEKGAFVAGHALAMEGFSLLQGSEPMEEREVYTLAKRAAVFSDFLAKALGDTEGDAGKEKSFPLVALLALTLGESLWEAGEAEGREMEELIGELEALSFTLGRGLVYASDLELSALQRALLERAGIKEEEIPLFAEDVNWRYSKEDAGYACLMPEEIQKAKVKHRGRKPKQGSSKDGFTEEVRRRGRPLGRKNQATLEWEEKIKEEAQKLGIPFEIYLDRMRKEKAAQKRKERMQNKIAPQPDGKDSTERRGRGRPKGRKNNKTLEREAQEKKQEEQTGGTEGEKKKE